jgi:hypothetical protein
MFRCLDVHIMIGTLETFSACMWMREQPCNSRNAVHHVCVAAFAHCGRNACSGSVQCVWSESSSRGRNMGALGLCLCDRKWVTDGCDVDGHLA